MANLVFTKESIFSSPCKTLVNPVNTVGVMGKGLALAFKQKYPEMFFEYRSRCKAGQLQPGSFWLWKGPERWVLNLATKQDWRRPSKLSYIENSLDLFCFSYEDIGVDDIAFPKVGCGFGGLEWKTVKPIMVDKLGKLPITVHIHE